MSKKSKATTKKPAKRARKLNAHVTHLEMHNPPLRSLPVPSRPTLALIRARNISPKFYSFIYEQVGKPHHWEMRRNLSDTKLKLEINNSEIEISVLYVEGCPAGFFELSTAGLRQAATEEPYVEISYLGLAPEYQKLGIGKWFMSAAIQTAWSLKPSIVKVETNTLDHPAALPLYQRLGFSPVAVSEVTIKEWI